MPDQYNAEQPINTRRRQDLSGRPKATPTESTRVQTGLLRSPWWFVRRWVLGFVVGTLVMWAVSFHFLRSVVPYVNSPITKSVIPAEGHAHDFRDEGWATTHFGKYGISGIADVTAISGPKIAIWGDSHVQAFQVADGDKVAQQVSQISAEDNMPVTGVGIASGDRVVGDYCFQLPQYERIIDPRCHFIVLSNDVNDVCPDGLVFLSKPKFHFKDRNFRPTMTGGRSRGILEHWRLRFLWQAMRVTLKTGPARTQWRKFRFSVGPVPTAKPDPERPDPASYLDAWRYLLKEIRQRAYRPVVFIYAPRTPFIEKGRVSFDDPARPMVEGFKNACRDDGVAFIDLTRDFEEFYRQTGEFPRGFNNGFISRGHWNEHGHRLVARAIVRYLRESKDLILTD